MHPLALFFADDRIPVLFNHLPERHVRPDPRHVGGGLDKFPHFREFQPGIGEYRRNVWIHGTDEVQKDGRVFPAGKAHVDEPIVMLIPFPNPQLALLYFDFQR